MIESCSRQPHPADGRGPGRVAPRAAGTTPFQPCQHEWLVEDICGPVAGFWSEPLTVHFECSRCGARRSEPYSGASHVAH